MFGMFKKINNKVKQIFGVIAIGLVLVGCSLGGNLSEYQEYKWVLSSNDTAVNVYFPEETMVFDFPLSTRMYDFEEKSGGDEVVLRQQGDSEKAYTFEVDEIEGGFRWIAKDEATEKYFSDWLELRKQDNQN